MKMHTPDFHSTINQWDEAMAQEAEEKRKMADPTLRGDTVHQYGNGYSLQRLHSPQSLTYEGDCMGHCVGSYDQQVNDGKTMIYSLRDHKNVPHVTMEVTPQRYEKKPFDLQHAIENNLVLRPTLHSSEPHLQALREGIEAMHAQHGHKEPYYHNHPTFDPARHFHDPYMTRREQEGYLPSDPVGKGLEVKDKLTPEEQYQSLYYTLRRNHENERGTPVINGGLIEQIQGQGNTIPKPEYQQMVKEFMEKLPPQERPAWRGGTINDLDELDEDMGGYHAHGDYGVEGNTKFDWESMIEEGAKDRYYSQNNPDKLVNAAIDHDQLSELSSASDQAMRYMEDNWIGDNEDRFTDDEIAAWAGLERENYTKPNPDYDPEYYPEDPEEVFDEERWDDDIDAHRQDYLRDAWEESPEAEWLYNLDNSIRNAMVKNRQ